MTVIQGHGVIKTNEKFTVAPHPGASTLAISRIENAILPQRCDLYVHVCAILNAHHIVPESWWKAAGKPVDTPMINLCPNCHMNTHAAIDAILTGRGTHFLPRRCVDLARQGIETAEEVGLTPRRTL